MLVVFKGWDWDDCFWFNVNGFGIFLGYLIGVIGVWILMILFYEFKCCGGKYGLEIMCVGGG